MKAKPICFIFAFVVLSAVFLSLNTNKVSADEGNSTHCGTVNASFTLAANLVSNGTCYVIGNNSLVIDGGGFSITGNGSGNGFNLNSKNNITIVNFGAIKNFTIGIETSTGNDCVIRNNTIITANTSDAYGIDINSISLRCRVTSNNLTIYGSSSWGVVFFSGTDHIIENNLIFSDYLAGGISTTANNQTIKNNNITVAGIGIQIGSTSSLYLNNIINSSSHGVVLSSNNNANNISYNTILTRGSSAHGIYGTCCIPADHNYFLGNTITTTGSSSNGIFFDDTGINNTFVNNVLSSITGTHVRTDNAEVILINTTFNKNSITIGNGNLTIKWYVDVIVKNASNGIMQNANVTIKNVSSIIVSSNLTDTAGRIPTQTLEEYWRNSSTIIYSTPYAITATLSNFLANGTSINLTLTNSTLVTMVIHQDPCLNISTNFLLTTNVDVNGTCITIGAHNLVIDGGGFSITGNNSGFGINNSDGFDNLTIKNFPGINNFTEGIVFQGSVNSTIYNNSIRAASVTGGHGIDLSLSSNSTRIALNTITASGTNADGIVLTTSSFVNVSFNNITTYGGGGEAVSLKNTATDNLVYSNTLNTTGGSAHVIWLSESSRNNISSNFVNAQSSGYGIQLSSSSDSNRVTSNTVTTSSVGLDLSLSSSDNILASNTITTTGSSGFGLRLDSQASRNALSNNIITTTHSVAAYGIYLSGSQNNTLTNDRINATNSVDLYLYGPGTFAGATASGNILTNVIINGDVNLSSSSFNNVSVDIDSSPPAAPSHKKNFTDFLSIVNLSIDSFIDFNLTFSANEVTGINNQTAKIYHYNATTSAWQALSTSTVSVSTNGLAVSSGNITSFSRYAPFGNLLAGSIIIHSPANTSNHTSNFLINATAENASFVSYRYENSTTNSSWISMSNPTGDFWNATFNISSVADGRYTLRINASDGAVDNTTATITFNIDTTAPLVYIANSSFNTSDNTPSIFVNFTDAYSSSANCTLYFNNTAYNSSTINNATNSELTVNASISDGVYTITANCTDFLGNRGTSSAISVTIDTISPSAAAFNSPASSSYHNTNFVLNVTITGSPAYAQYKLENGTNSSQIFINYTNLTNSASNFWNATINITSLANWNYTIRILAADALNNTNSTQTILINLDAANPSIASFACSDINQGSSQSCTCTASDNSQSYGGAVITSISSADTSTAGSKSVVCTATDTAGNTNTNSATYTVNAAASSSSGSSLGATGSISSGIEGQFSKKVWSQIKEGETAAVAIKDKEVAVTNIEFTANENIKGASITVTKRESLPSNIRGTSKKVYRYLEITKAPTIKEESIKNIKVGFQVAKSWLAENKLDKSSIALLRYKDDSWIQLQTEIREENADVVNYTAITPGFSYFAIGEKSQEITPADQEKISEATIASGNLTQLSEKEEVKEEVADKKAEKETPQQEKAEENKKLRRISSKWTLTILIIIGLASFIIWLKYFKHGKR